MIQSRRRARIIWWLAVLGVAGSARGQGFVVKPSMLELSAPPGGVVAAEVGFTSTSSAQPTTLLIDAFTATQNEEGVWQAVEEGQTPQQVDRERSCQPWLELGARELVVGPAETKALSLRLQVPQDARGTYAAMLSAATKGPPPQPGHYRVRVRFLIPILLTVEGTVSRPQLAIDSVAMVPVPKTDQQAGMTRYVIRVTNQGNCYQRTTAAMTLLRPSEQGWRRVSQVPLPGRIILPGHTVAHVTNAPRRFPAGKYQLKAEVRTAGRVAGRLDSEVEYPGDPDALRVVSDVEITMEPQTLSADLAPGGQRSVAFTVSNRSDEPVTLAAAAELPQALRRRSIGEVVGESYDCSPWLTVSPKEGTLPPLSRRSFRITATLPREQGTKARYYSDIVLTARTATGEEVGTCRAMLTLRNKAAAIAPKAAPSSLALERAEGTRYLATAVFANVGDVEFACKCRVELVAAGLQIVKSADMDEPQELVIPLGSPRFTKELDFADVPPGSFVLRTVFTFGKEVLTYGRRLDVKLVGGVPQAVLLAEEITAAQ